MRPFQVPAHTAPNSYRLDIPCRAPEPLPLPSRPPLRRIGARRRRCLAPTARPSARCGSCASSRCSTAPAAPPARRRRARSALPPTGDRRLRRLLHPHKSAGRVYGGRGAARRPWRGTGGPERICSRGAFSQTRTWWPTRCSRRCAAQWTRCSTPHPTAPAGCFSRRHGVGREKRPAGAVGRPAAGLAPGRALRPQPIPFGRKFKLSLVGGSSQLSRLALFGHAPAPMNIRIECSVCSLDERLGDEKPLKDIDVQFARAEGYDTPVRLREDSTTSMLRSTGHSVATVVPAFQV